ncbi:TetR/AcrR family transcriptional regulator [Reichenbachiella sp. MALMAid0571]|uniref:TetR/AcrR family transcriptional regulator n=1 Tax=Reichenbachiella sp. MALMAid0571 TaxID=3143939 RepID=UPI0032DF31E4
MNVAENILEKADALFNKYGIRSISMDEIARELGISKKTIYQYFKDKDDMVYQITRNTIEKDKSEFEAAMKQSGNLVSALVQMSKCLRENFNKINPSLIFDVQKYHPQSWSMWMDYKNDFIFNTILNTIEKGKTEGIFRQEINAEILAKFRIEQVQMSFDEKIFPRNKFDFKEVQLALFDHFVHGVLTPKGLKIYDDLTKPKGNA